MALEADVPSPTSVVALLLLPTAAATSTPPPTSADPDDQGECRLMGPFALIVQLALGGLALLSLVFKRWRERPQRPVRVWFFDVSKQVFGSVLVHIANVFLSILTSGRLSIKPDPGVVQAAARRLLARDDDEVYVPNPCSFYLLNLAIDTTLGIPILLVLLRVFTGLAARTSWGQPSESIQSGWYGNPPHAYWWLKQSVIYFCGLFGMKAIVLFVFLVLPWISRVGDWALGWTEGNERLQIVFVMMLFPLIMNALQYYIIDSFIKEKQSGHEPLPGQDPDASGESGGRGGSVHGSVSRTVAVPPPGSGSGDVLLSPGLSLDGLISDDEDGVQMRPPRRPSASPPEYDPDFDGDTLTGNSSAPGKGYGKLLTKDLLPGG